MTHERWLPIPEFPNYEISDKGNVYNLRHNHQMSVSYTNHGHAKITLTSEWTGERFTRSVSQLVAEAFVEPPDVLCDQVVVLDGDLSNIAAENLVWRPRWFAWRYVRQLKTPQPTHYTNLYVHNRMTHVHYSSIVEAGMTEGLLFADIWKSTYRGTPTYPTGFVYEILQRV